MKEIDSKINNVLEYLIKEIPPNVEYVKFWRIDDTHQRKSFLDEYVFPEVSDVNHWYKSIEMILVYRSNENKEKFINGLKDIIPADRVPSRGKWSNSDSVRLSDGLLIDFIGKLELITTVFENNKERYDLQKKLWKICYGWRKIKY